MFATTAVATHNLSVQRLQIAALVVLLAVSAGALVLARSHDYWWVGWVALLPLFVSIRILPPVKAMLAGAFWGLCLFVFLNIAPPRKN